MARARGGVKGIFCGDDGGAGMLGTAEEAGRVLRGRMRSESKQARSPIHVHVNCMFRTEYSDSWSAIGIRLSGLVDNDRGERR
jgi:hypothetical protein